MAGRDTVMMPSIKCSSCSQQVEISMMGEHICGGAESMAAQIPFGKGVHDIGSIPPVDTAMANRNFARSPLTPLSMSGTSRSASPRTPNQRAGPNYFNPQILNDDYNVPPNGRRPGGYGGFGEEADNMYASSPRKQSVGFQGQQSMPPLQMPMNPNQRSMMRDNGPQMPRYTPEERRPSASGSLRQGQGGPRAPRNNGYGGFGAPGQDSRANASSFGPPARADTFPVPDRSFEPPARTPSAPPPRSDAERRPSISAKGRMTPDTMRRPPPRQSPIQQPKPAAGRNTPSVNLADEFGIGNPYHSPSNSESSTFSAKSMPESSAGTSPARSVGGGRRNQDKSAFDGLRDMSRSLPSSNSRNDPRSRQDPAIQSGILSPSPDIRPDSRGNPARPGTSRGNCRACNAAITGKSISSADGRLTGRYHKSCFACTTCREPFATAEFYVHGDKPYCKRHYHKINGSLCGSCSDGIEGEYLEDESAKKHHVDCFRCGDCNFLLRDGYFEVDGKVYCERDALKRLQPAPPPPQPQFQPPMRGQSRGPPPSRGAYMQQGPGGGGRQPMGGSGPPPRGGLPPRPTNRLEKRRTRIGMM